MPATPKPPPYRGRFAPSPTGPLHFGSLVAAFGSWLMARHAGGEWLIRIEDLDPPREVAGAMAHQLATLATVGLQSDGPVLRQSERSPMYHAALDRLLASGDAFECHCSRSALADTRGVHRQCVATAARSDPSIRLRVRDDTVIGFADAVRGDYQQDVATQVGDFILRRADGFWAYQLAVVVDDAAQGVTDVVRGADLLDSTPRQILLQRMLGLPTPRYAHLPLLADGHGRKLGKSQAAAPVDAQNPVPALQMAWAALGQATAAVMGERDCDGLLQAALRAFDPTQIPVKDVIFAATHNSPATKPALESIQAPHPDGRHGETA